jgi:hypothetical protein
MGWLYGRRLCSADWQACAQVRQFFWTPGHTKRPKIHMDLMKFLSIYLKGVLFTSVHPWIIYIINVCHRYVFPQHLKYAVIKPLFKKGDISSISNYKPISPLTSWRNASCCVILYNFFVLFPSQHNFQNLIHISLCIMRLLALIVQHVLHVSAYNAIIRQYTLINIFKLYLLICTAWWWHYKPKHVAHCCTIKTNKLIIHSAKWTRFW